MLKIENHEILGPKILIKLIPYKESISTNEAGILIPLYENYETDGGRPAARIKEDEYSCVGKVIQIPKAAKDYLDSEKMEVSVGDMITISHNQKHPSNQFLVNKDVQVQEFEGYLIIHPSLIQSKIINYYEY